MMMAHLATGNSIKQEEGHGVFTWADGDKYDGDWKDNKKEGRGTCTWPDGQKYAGEYKLNIREGEGTYIAKNGREFSGRWSGGLLNGKSLDTLDIEARSVQSIPFGCGIILFLLCIYFIFHFCRKRLTMARSHELRIKIC